MAEGTGHGTAPDVALLVLILLAGICTVPGSIPLGTTRNAMGESTPWDRPAVALARALTTGTTRSSCPQPRACLLHDRRPQEVTTRGAILGAGSIVVDHLVQTRYATTLKKLNPRPPPKCNHLNAHFQKIFEAKQLALAVPVQMCDCLQMADCARRDSTRVSAVL